ncbi:MAG: hypothetical protein ACOVSI_08650 [Gemmatimonas sp.]
MLDALLWFLPLFGHGAGVSVAPLTIMLDDIRDVSPTCELVTRSPTVDLVSLAPVPEVVPL